MAQENWPKIWCYHFSKIGSTCFSQNKDIHSFTSKSVTNMCPWNIYFIPNELSFKCVKKCYFIKTFAAKKKIAHVAIQWSQKIELFFSRSGDSIWLSSHSYQFQSLHSTWALLKNITMLHTWDEANSEPVISFYSMEFWFKRSHIKFFACSIKISRQLSIAQHQPSIQGFFLYAHH